MESLKVEQPAAKKWFCSACREETTGCGKRSRGQTEGKTTVWSDSFVQCLTCPEFIARAESDPRGWSGFVAEQAKATMGMALARSAETMEMFFQIMTSLPDGLVTVDKEGRVTYFNPTAQRMTGISVDDAIGKQCSEVLPDSACARQFAAGEFESTCDDFGTSEYCVNRASNRPLPVMSSASLIRDDRHKVIGAVEVFKDISVRRKLERDLRKSEHKYRRIFENTKDMIFILSRDGMITDVNEACVETLDYDNREELLSSGSMGNNYLYPLHAKVFQKQIDRWGYIRDFETLLKTKNGVQLHCLVTGNAILNDRREVIGYEGIVKDITARMHAIQSLQRRNNELSLLNSVALTINATLNLRSALVASLDKVLEVVGPDAGAVFLIDRAKSSFSLAAQQGLFRQELEESCELTLSDTLLMKSMFSEKVVLAPESTFPPFKGVLKVGPESQEFLLLCFLISGKERPLGFFALDIGDEASISEQNFGLLGSLGNFLGGAIDNFILQKEKKRRSKELKELTAKMFQTQEVERERIARELHDEAGQSLTGINLALDSINKRVPEDVVSISDLVGEVRSYVNHTYNEMRRISHRLHPAILSDLGLEAALGAYFEWIIRHSSLHIEYKVVGFEESLDPELAISLYRLSQEAFTNTQKHANAGSFRLSIIKSFPRVIFVAEDDGEGFDPSVVDRVGRSLGLVSMRERAAMLGGTFSLRSSKGQGTMIRIEIPVKESSDEN